MQLFRIKKIYSLLFLLTYLCTLKALPSMSQYYLSKKNINLRNSFPGRRVGGGTRAICDSSAIVHLVPSNNVFSPGHSRRLALLKRKTIHSFLSISKFRKYTTKGMTGEILMKKTLNGPSGIYLIQAPYFKNHLIWESSLICPNSNENDTGLFGYDHSLPPPARTLLLREATNDDMYLADNIKWLTQFCNSSVDIKDFSRRFPLDDLSDSMIGSKLIVHCDGLK